MRLTEDQTRLLARSLRNESALAMEHARIMANEYGNSALAKVWREHSEDMLRWSDELRKPYFLHGCTIEPSR